MDQRRRHCRGATKMESASLLPSDEHGNLKSRTGNQKVIRQLRFASKAIIGKLKKTKRRFGVKKNFEIIQGPYSNQSSLKTKILDFTLTENVIPTKAAAAETSLTNDSATTSDSDNEYSDKEIVLKFMPSSIDSSNEGTLEEVCSKKEQYYLLDNLQSDGTDLPKIVVGETSETSNSIISTSAKAIDQAKQGENLSGEKGDQDLPTNKKKHVTFGASDIRWYTIVAGEKPESENEPIECSTNCAEESKCNDQKPQDISDDRFDLLAESPCPPIVSDTFKAESLKDLRRKILKRTQLDQKLAGCGCALEDDMEDGNATGTFKRTQMEVIARQNVAIITEEGAPEEQNEGRNTDINFSSADFAAAKLVTEKLSEKLQNDRLSRCAECKVEEIRIPVYSSPCSEDFSFTNGPKALTSSEFEGQSQQQSREEKLVQDIRELLSKAQDKLRNGISKVSAGISKSAAYASERVETDMPNGFAVCNKNECTPAQCHGGASAFREPRSNASFLSVSEIEFNDWDELDQTFNDSFSLDVTAISRVDTDSVGLNP